MKKLFIFVIIALAVLGVFLFNLPKETLTITDIQPIKLTPIMIP